MSYSAFKLAKAIRPEITRYEHCSGPGSTFEQLKKEIPIKRLNLFFNYKDFKECILGTMKKFSNSNKLKATNLIQPIFIEEGLKSKKIIKGLGGIIVIHQSAKKTIMSDINKGIKNFLFYNPKE